MYAGLPPMSVALPPVALDDHGSGGVGGVGGPIAALLQTNYAILDQFKANMQAWQVGECSVILVTSERPSLLSYCLESNRTAAPCMQRVSGLWQETAVMLGIRVERP